LGPRPEHHRHDIEVEKENVMGKKLFSIMAVALSAAVVLTACSSTANTTNAADTASTPASTSAGGEVKRQAAKLDPRTVGIVNNTGGDITLSISGTDNYDWESARPDHPAPEGFQGTVLGYGKTETRTLIANRNASLIPFTINFGVTSAKVELTLKNDLAASNIHDGDGESSTYTIGGWNTRAADYCELNTVKSAGYTITVVCSYYTSPNTTVTISK
jgi:hypothetical protein